MSSSGIRGRPLALEQVLHLPGDEGRRPASSTLFNASLGRGRCAERHRGFLFYRTHRRVWILAIFVLAGLGAAGAGLVPLNTNDLHGLFAFLAFLFFNLEALACASVVHGPMRGVSALAGIAGLAFVMLMVSGDAGNAGVFGPIGHGGAERMIVYPPMLWMLAFGGYLLGPSAPEGSGPAVT